ncbi:Carbon catabolite repressor protein 4 -like protein 5 [Capsicum annuum]|uniref:carbon catabolite repressor protein 4 homolog 5 isoform X1 n=1 Tax=Capsicum annuum TaxID=4072 RepID=UPI001FB0DB55|nr:carbon catabolite repressor protein 4 homolog 5 isoform X1 [Capsicum annuum]KAF3645137.1 Carbon catabolite repressor protein 4 -like protein 5 [Capsicum annuum]
MVKHAPPKFKSPGDGRNSPANEPSRSSTSKKSRSIQHDMDQHRSKKKQKLTIHQTQTETETLTLNHTSTSYTHTYANSYTYSYSKGKEKRRKGKSKKAIADDKRKWVYSTHHISPLQDRVVFMSYNILGVKNAAAHEDLYLNVSPKYLDWDYRKKLICKEIRDYNPGIMCFQEVDRFDDLDHLLVKEGFKGVYQARTGDACDGCAIFWNSKLFDILHEESIEFQNFNLRNNVCQLCVFKMNVKSSNKDMSASNSESVSSLRFLVGNIHVLYNPNRGDIKLGQVRLFLESAQRLSQEWGDIPVVLAGDLNSMPQSAMYQFLTSNKLDIQMHDRKQISGQIYPFQNRSFNPRFCNRWSNEELMLATGTGASYLIHQLQLSSAYAGTPGSSRTRGNSGEPLATSYHFKFMGTVDYIWHTTGFVPVRVLDTLPVDILRRTRGLPSKKWGSDHLSLLCELAFADEGSEA